MKINRALCCIISLIISVMFVSCDSKKELSEGPAEIDGLVFEKRAELKYADQFEIDRYKDGFSLIQTGNGSRYLIVPEGKAAPERLDSDIIVISRPVKDIYIAATSSMGIFEALDCGEAVKFSGTKAEDWYIDYAREAMEQGDMLYAGKYREPDYELLLSGGCGLSIQSTMIEHSPEVKEKLEELGIMVFVDYSSYESHPLGRSEWIKVYGEIMGKAKEAERIFNEQADYLKGTNGFESTGKTAVFFYISNSGQAVTRKSGDYVTNMIELAGGENVFHGLGKGNSSSAVTMEMEKFYETAKDADFIIYNSTIGGEIDTIDELISKNSLLSDFKAVKEDNVWCTRNNLFQETMKLGTVISDFNSVFTGNAKNDPPQFLYKLESGEENE